MTSKTDPVIRLLMAIVIVFTVFSGVALTVAVITKTLPASAALGVFGGVITTALGGIIVRQKSGEGK